MARASYRYDKMAERTVLPAQVADRLPWTGDMPRFFSIRLIKVVT